MQIAVLEDDIIQLDFTSAIVRALGHVCTSFRSGRELLGALHRRSFDLLILDWDVPGTSGYDVLRWVRQGAQPQPPVLFITNQSDERDIVAALDAGADDYMTKPVRVAELAARVSALLRRAWPRARDEVTLVGAYCIRRDTATISVHGQVVPLKQKEFALACLLLTNPGRLLTRDYLQAALWGQAPGGQSRALDTHVCRLRTVLHLRPENGVRLLAVYSHGYRFEVLAAPGADPAWAT